MTRARLLLVVSLVAAAPVAAEGEPRPVAVAVDFAPPSAGPTWFSAALAELTRRELGRFSAVTIADTIGRRRCPGRSTPCLIDAYREQGVELILLGTVERRGLVYEAWETWTPARAYGGVMPVEGVSTATLSRHIGELVRPIVQRGGLVDRRPAPPPSAAIAPTAPSVPAAPTAETPHGLLSPRRLVPLLFVLLAALLALPPLVARLLVRRRELRKHAPPASWKWSAALAASAATLAVGTAIVDVTTLFAAPAPPLATMLVPLAAGVMWGALALALVGWILAPIGGLGHIRHDALWSLLGAWAALALLRALVLSIYVPIALATLRLCAVLAIPTGYTWALAIPGVGLLVYFWFLTLVDNLALYLDMHLVVGRASKRNPWHGTIKRYFRGYVRRNGVQLDHALLDRALFLPSFYDDVIAYGGGFARPRVLVGETAREAAFGGLPEETEFPERTVNDEELPVGMVLPLPLVSREVAPSVEPRRRVLTQAPARPRAVLPRIIGEAATLLGWVMPQPGGEGVPLIANTVEDYDVVKRLLTAHYAAFERNLDDDEVDDTDPTQKDFLFGAILRSMGILARRDGLIATLWYAVALAQSRAGRILARAPVTIYQRLLSGPAARVADAYVALNHGLHHLIQYLGFQRGEDESQLTARADEPLLLATSREMLDRVERGKDERGERGVARRSMQRRALWLSRFFAAPLSRRLRLSRALGVAAFVTVAGLVVAILARQAIAYHPKYLEEIQSQKESK